MLLLLAMLGTPVDLPRIDDATVQAVLVSEDTIWYTGLTPAYQDWRGALKGVHAVSSNVSADSSEPFGNPNREFPWGTPGGVHLSENVEAEKFLSLPMVDGKMLPVTWWREGQEYHWIFPEGTIVGEVLYMRHGDSRLCFELRVRIRENSDWAVDIFKPFPSRNDYLAALLEIDPRLAIAAVIPNIKELRLRPPQPHNNPFDERALVEYLKAVPPEVVARLLNRTFRSALGVEWSDEADGVTVDEGPHIVPVNYAGAFLGNDREACRNCHRDIGEYARDIQARHRDGQLRHWYGSVRGSDGIFSWHPFTEASISRSGTPNPVSIRGEKTIERYNRRVHGDRYRQSGFTKAKTKRQTRQQSGRPR